MVIYERRCKYESNMKSWLHLLHWPNVPVITTSVCGVYLKMFLSVSFKRATERKRWCSWHLFWYYWFLDSGDTDAVIPVTSTRYSIDALKLPTVSPYRAWYDDGQVSFLCPRHPLILITTTVVSLLVTEPSIICCLGKTGRRMDARIWRTDFRVSERSRPWSSPSQTEASLNTHPDVLIRQLHAKAWTSEWFVVLALLRRWKKAPLWDKWCRRSRCFYLSLNAVSARHC